MADITTLQAQAELLRTQMEVLQLRAQLLQRDHRDLALQLGQINAQLQRAAEPAPPVQSPTADPPADEALQAELARIAKAGHGELPSLVTRQAQNDDGSPKRDADGNVILLHQNGEPLTVIERAILARQAELRAAAGG